MTIIIAGRYKNSFCLGCDSAVISGWSRLKNLKNFTKIVAFPMFFVGLCGSCTISETLKRFSQDPAFLVNGFMGMQDARDASFFAEAVFSTLKDYAKNRLAREANSEAELESTQMLIISKSGIYNVDDYLNSLEYEKFYTIGCGNDLATGAMEVLYPSVKDRKSLKKAIETSIAVACKYSSGCDLPVTCVEIE